MKHKLITFLTLTFIVSCGGGGGGGGSSPAPAPTGGSTGGSSGGGTTYSYDPIIGNYTNKTWDAFGAGILANFSSANKLTFIDYTGINNNDLSVSLSEISSTNLELDYSGSASLGSTFTFNLNLNGFNTTEVPLYEYGETQPSFSFYTSTFADAATRFFMPSENFLQKYGVEYVGFAQMEIARLTDNRYFVLPTFYGDYTETGDMPNSSKTLSIRSIGYYHNESTSGNIQLAIAGDGSLNIDFANNTLSGELIYDEYILFEEFVAGNGANSQITTLSSTTLTITNGQIVGSKFTADVTSTDGAGRLVGYFFGPDANEFGASLILLDNDGETASDYFAFSAGLVGY
ncbi:transferrin-binding protein-like solute binding protein [Gammaproteobacteria bacterium]|nr:transferrin-binding protein-like solute binding protein [Gammaproteobacteria bacterium]